MGIFQQSVLIKYLYSLSDKEKLINDLYSKYLANYGSNGLIESIKKINESKYTDGFLNDVFVELLGYTKNPKPRYNLSSQVKNEIGSRIADAAIYKDEKVIAVFELKDTSTKISDKGFIQQAFDYLNFHTYCRYVIISNFQYLRFYIDKRTEFEEFNLFNLTKEGFKKLYLILSKDSILNDIPLKMKEESEGSEENISKKFYKDYSRIRSEILENMKLRNEQYNELILFQKTQKLLDRLLFMLFAEDKGLLEPNTMEGVIKEYKQRKHLDVYEPFYTTLKRYFKYIDKGYTSPYVNGIESKVLPPYNGELFKPDDILDDKITIDDNALIENIETLVKYDFNSELDINVLGHIFEHSLNDIEEIKANLENKDIHKRKTKRKKEGIFYTPDFITDFIINSTLEVLCGEKKKGLGLDKEVTKENVKQYKEFLRNLKVLDPACGSGAFLNKALEFLRAENEFVGTKRSQLADKLDIFETQEAILENNLYGVDINEESIEIAKLSLWLHTAHRGRKLCNLSQNIKCGNSLIDDKEEAEKAFNWNEEYKDIMDNGGFDIIIGNPPYVRQEEIKEFKSIFQKHYEVYDSISDIYTYFYERAFNLLKEGGLLCLITSNKWMRARYGTNLRRFLKEKTELKQIIDMSGCKVFESATVDTCIVVLKKALEVDSKNKVQTLTIKHDFDSSNDDLMRYVKEKANKIEQGKLDIKGFILENDAILTLKRKIESIGTPLKDWDIKIYRGVLTGFNEAFIIDNDTRNRLCKEDSKSKDIIKPMLRGRDIRRYYYNWAGLWVIVIPAGWTNKNKGSMDAEEYCRKTYFSIYKHLKNKGEGFKRKDIKTKGNGLYEREDYGDYWWELRHCTYYQEFEKEKIIYPETTVRRSEFVYDDSKIFLDKTCFFSNGTQLQYLSPVLSSRVIEFYLESELRLLGKRSIQYSKQYMENLPIPIITPENKSIAEGIEIKADQMLSMHKAKHLLERFVCKKGLLPIESGTDDMITIKRLLREEGSKENDDRSILNEIAKKIINRLTEEIDKTDSQIDTLVYRLYNLTDEEIGIIEGEIKP